MNDHDGTTSLTVEQAASSVFEGFLSAEENRKDRETPPTQESPESAKPEPEAAPEQAKDEGKSEEPEQTDEPAETPASNALDPSTKVKTKVDGEEIEVTLEEALKGYSRTQDYTRKTQQLSESRKAFETEQTAVRTERQQLAQYFTQLEAVLTELSPKEPNPADFPGNPAAFQAKWTEYQQLKQDREAVRQQKEQALAAVQADSQKAMEAHLGREKALLLEAIPEWKTPEVASAEKAKLAAFAKEVGYTAEEIGQVIDHRAIKLLRDAMLFRELQAKKPAAQARIEKVTTAKPGSGEETRLPVSETTRRLQRLAKTGRVDDAAAAFESML